MLDPDDKREGPPRRAVEPIDPKDITPEQVRMYKDCMYGLIFKAGLPYASLAHLLTLWRTKPDVQQQQPTPPQGFPVKRAFFFFANMIIGTFLFAPLCYYALVEKHNEDRKRRVELPVAPVTEKAQSTRLPDDYMYPLDLSSNLREAESTFTSEYSPSRMLANEDEVTKITPTTTYQDLRNKHRSTYGRRPEPPPPEDPKKSPFGIPEENPADNEPSFSKREPRKFVKRNKYGDEIE